MGVPGLWDIIKDAGESRSLANMAVVGGFEKNSSRRRALRVGIDVSLWFHQVSLGKFIAGNADVGDNPQLRTLFFRLCALAELPITPLFVFDGRKRPKIKRGSRMGKSGSHPLSQPMKLMLDHFGMQWCEALGEAEAELACLNQDGLIDAIVTDDCDALIFGGKTIIRNASLDLSGNKANPALDANGKASKYHVMVYTADAVRDHPKVGLSRGALLLFALLAGGDYHSGVLNLGKVTASALVRCGFGDQLLRAFETRVHDDQLKVFLVGWRAEINAELRSNSRGFLKQRHTSLTLPPDFPDFEVLANYNVGGRTIRDNRELNTPALAGFCEDKFSVRSGATARTIIKRFRTLLWKAAVVHVLRRAAILADAKEPTHPAVGTPTAFVRQVLGFVNKADPAARFAAAFVNQGPPPETGTVPDEHPLLVRLVNARNHVSTDGLLEFRAEVCPVQLVALAESGIKGTRAAPSSSDERRKKSTPEPESVVRMWIPAAMLQQVHPALVEEYFERPPAGRKRKGKARDIESDLEETDPSPSAAKSSQQKGNGARQGRLVTDIAPQTPTPTPTPPERNKGLDWRSEIDRILAAPPLRKTKKRSTAANESEAVRSKKRRVSVEMPEFLTSRLEPSRQMDDIIDLTSD
ncbi:hypothetical protein B0H11DRAFT_2170838 [Mycena galericulata]|nr:hypothetical protein B0H11DRAFT_2170838 [Mycena galericulata]